MAMGGQTSSMEHNAHFMRPVYKDLLSFAFDEKPVAYDEYRPLYVDAENPSLSLNAHQVRLFVRTVIAGLKKRANLEAGECVLVTLPNNVLYSSIFYSIIGAGGIYMGINPASQYAELEHFLELSTPKLIITAPTGLGLLQEVTKAKGIPQDRICVLDQYAISYLTEMLSPPPSGPNGEAARKDEYPQDIRNKEVLNFSALLRHGEGDWIRFDNINRCMNTPAAMYTTSGTGGLPKGALLSHHSIVMHHQSLYYDTPYDITRLICIPMFHLFGALFTHIWPIRYGETCYILPRFDIAQFVKTIYLYRITETFMVPAMVHALNKCPDLELSEFFRSLRYIGSAGASLDSVSAQRLEVKLHPEAQVCQLWGMTEAGVAFQVRYGCRDATASIGRLLPNYEVKLLDIDDQEVTAEDTSGELYVRGPGLLMEYKGIPNAKDENGWFRTGDVVTVRDGKYYVVGRAKELIKVRGWQVAPAEIEGVLLKHPCIADAAAVGIKKQDTPDQHEDELVRAFVVRRKTIAAARLTGDEVYRFARHQLVSYKSLTGGVVFVDEIPRTPSGKIQRFKLVEMCAYRDLVSSLLFFKPQVENLRALSSAHSLGLRSIGQRKNGAEAARIELRP
ncbi:adenylate-forming enzyme AfeA [Talaromyces stipitatus ATCC 10500]|uniref:Adenylate-forming enzyme AfeA n=1 Tax=Talaromyces stipitatus (strain ATCC 10500 / CBS 375.48 / QM 6759 / NRRL 1006) TaxID=441959 RepID=B8M515_TALSN|nr:adenylate-forming enzyme AfeA [Talaromyces stipitatus ATCC 10500]EED19621.1 adenylate-forming enzyme AfeA [Talaromyces stipitatus ATCC 10500]